MAPPTDIPRYRDYVRQTLAKRIPAILEMARENQDAEPLRQLNALARAVEADAPMVMDLHDWPLPGWEALPARVNGRRPSEAAFFDFEYWLYYRILLAVRYASTRNDPFRPTKHRDLGRHIDWADGAIETVHSFAGALNLSLDANAHDLSQTAGPAGRHEIGRQILDMPTDGLRRLNIIADNFGGEFVADLILAIIAAEAGLEAVVHVKHLPMFVSDTTTDDVIILFDRLKPGSAFGRRLQAGVDDGRIRFASNSFWSAPLFMDRVPVEELEEGDDVLTVLKGDLNFRRAVGDPVVPVDMSFASLAVQPATPMLALRSIKSYCAAGMSDWPSGLSKDNFPTDGSIITAQRLPGRATASA